MPLIPPQTQFEDRLNQLDLRLSKVMRMGPRYRLQANFDVYNVFNASSMLTPQQHVWQPVARPGDHHRSRGRGPECAAVPVQRPAQLLARLPNDEA